MSLTHVAVSKLLQLQQELGGRLVLRCWVCSRRGCLTTVCPLSWHRLSEHRLSRKQPRSHRNYSSTPAITQPARAWPPSLSRVRGYQHLCDSFAHFSPLLHSCAKHPQILLGARFWVARDDIQGFQHATSCAGWWPRHSFRFTPSCARNRSGSRRGQWHPLPTVEPSVGRVALEQQQQNALFFLCPPKKGKMWPSGSSCLPAGRCNAGVWRGLEQLACHLLCFSHFSFKNAFLWHLPESSAWCGVFTRTSVFLWKPVRCAGPLWRGSGAMRQYSKRLHLLTLSSVGSDISCGPAGSF